MGVSNIVESLLTGFEVEATGIKRVTSVLSFVKYAELCKLAKGLGVSPSHLSKLLLEDAIQSAKGTYLQSTGLDSDFEAEVTALVDQLLERQSQADEAI